MNGPNLPERFALSDEQRQEIIEIIGCNEDEVLFMRIEEVLRKV